MNTVYVDELAKFLNLTPMTSVDASEIEIVDIEVNRPALQLAGFYDYFNEKSVQIVGNVECAYLASLEADERNPKIEELLSRKIPCLIYCRDHEPFPGTIELARKYGVPLYKTSEATNIVAEMVMNYLQKRKSETITVHGVLVDVFGLGVMITGESGIGKSEAALELIKRGHRLVSDDAVVIQKIDNDLIGHAPDVTRDFIELRGVGIIDVKSTFGLVSVKPEQKIDFVIRIEEWDAKKKYDRLGNEAETVSFLGKEIVQFSIPIRPGRNVAVIVETVAINYRQRSLGHDATREFYRRIQKNMQEQ